MWSFKSPREFLSRFTKLDRSRALLAISCMLLVFLYPGHNSLQTMVISSGPIQSYQIDPLPTHLYPESDGTKLPWLSASAVIVQDLTSKTILYSKNPDANLMPASITKVMTALVALDHWTDLETLITVKNEDRAIGQTIDLVKGESIALKNILYGLIVHSGNDAALAVADNYPGGYPAFVLAMNQKAKSLHLDSTVFKNPSGIDQYGHLTSVRDLAILSATALQNPVIAQMAETRRILVTDSTGVIVHDLETTNDLLGSLEGVKGLKTGWTSGAGECLITYVERDGHKLVVVVLGSSDRFGDSTTIINWAFDHHRWITPEL